MKVYVVIGWIAYEGYYEPEKVFASREKAVEWIEKSNSGSRYIDRYEIFEMDVE